MGGLRKTTIAKAIYNRIFKSFNGSSFLTNVREEASRGDKGLVSLQNQLLKDLLKRDHDIAIVSKGSELIEKVLSEKRVLLIFDDVDDRVQLDVLAGGINWFGQGSRVIITTRDDQSLNAHKVDKDIQIYDPEGLDPKNSLHLLSSYAFSKNEPPKEYKQLSDEIIHYADGLPLTLEVLGSFLFGKEKEEWEETIKGLKNILDNTVSKMSIKSYDEDVFAKLIISYNKLSDHAKIIFLDIACHFIGRETEDAISMWEACELHPRLAIKELTQKHLIKIEYDGYGQKFRMHDQLKFMGRKIVSKDSQGDPTKRTRLWSDDEILEVLEKDTRIKKLKVLLLRSCFELSGSLDFFSWFPCLQRLDLSGCTSLLELPDSICQMNSLKTLILDYCSIIKLPTSIGNLEHLVELSVMGTKIEELPDGVGQLEKLETLEASYCHKLVKLPRSMGRMRSLLHFRIIRCKCLTNMSGPLLISMSGSQLQVLYLEGYKILESLPELPSTLNSSGS
ncbi:disease resistance protein RUN1-like [Macadamia integrifolia]|uniref:disease resistance protein RUN1-like n=1 Tax=Macadamia integrifolia TaxID=60698 RepID=UPI001C530904|nr:disease resistance protein RUN1-like [Macadamia integrifolia]